MGQSVSNCLSIADLRRRARSRLPRPIYDYLEGGAEDEISLRRNRTAFQDFDLVPRYLIDVSDVDTSTRIFGKKTNMPLILAPTGMSRLFHKDAESGVARAAVNAGIFYTLSTLATESIETIAGIPNAQNIFQLYVSTDRGLNREIVARCKDAGYAGLCLTVDVPVIGSRERDARSGLTLPPRLTPKSLAALALRPAWVTDYIFGPPFRLANVAHKIDAGSRDPTSLEKYVASQFDPSVTWDEAAELMGLWGGPFAIKGILTKADAQRAASIGATTVIVSNHGGRQLDGVPASLDVLPEIADAVGSKLEIILDGGIRRGSDIAKALALGATACMVGRPYLYGLSSAGQKGVEAAISILGTEFSRCLALLGCRTVNDLGRGHVRNRPN